MAQDEKKLEALRSRLTVLCEDSLLAVGYELVELEYAPDGQGWVLRLFIDHPHHGPDAGQDEPVISTITLQDCTRASRHLSTVLDVEDPIDGNYRLELSSPGVNRPVRSARDFARFTGRMLRVQLRQPLDGRRNFTGRIIAATQESVDLEVGGALVQLPLDGIKKANLEMEF